jgi:hypothetical protein
LVSPNLGHRVANKNDIVCERSYAYSTAARLNEEQRQKEDNASHMFLYEEVCDGVSGKAYHHYNLVHRVDHLVLARATRSESLVWPPVTAYHALFSISGPLLRMLPTPGLASAACIFLGS